MLDPRIRDDLRATWTQMMERGELLTEDRLRTCYDLFRRRFGPEVLAGLDGEALLRTMHEHGNRDSLVYWIEFKDDEEFPATFGSIAGGSALKFGLYFRKETGQWMTGHPHQQQALSVDQAVAMARRHRDQLIAGANLLDSLPVEATADDYARLQQQMDQVAPDVSRLAWGHTLLDAKYRDLWEKSLPPEMLYQLAIYALTQPGENPVSIILYPSVTEAARDQVVEFRAALDGIAKASVILRPVHLLRLDGLLRAGSGVGAERQRQRQEMVAGLIRGVR